VEVVVCAAASEPTKSVNVSVATLLPKVFIPTSFPTKKQYKSCARASAAGEPPERS
jgi:hypothetical protein